MRRHLLAAGIAAATLIPTFALAQQSCEQQRSNRAAGTIAGAGIGAIAGGAVAGHDDRAAGVVIGGIAGAIIGNQVAKGDAGDCDHAYGYYDSNGRWHATNVARSNARGYYDRDGRWVAGAPNGYYDGQNRWVSANSAATASGYYDSNGYWVPASASGYYAANGQWVSGAASGYYSNGRWVSGPATGRYDSSGRWIAGQPSGRQVNGVWVADAQPGYYDTNGRWRAGPAMGYYDTQGRWIATASSAGYAGSNASYDTQDGPRDFRSRIARLDQRISRGMENGSLSRRESNRARSELNSIRVDESRMRHYRNGRLRSSDQARIDARLDALSTMLRQARDDDRRTY